MLESKYLKDDMRNIQRLRTIPALKNFETQDLGKLLRLSRIRHYSDGEIIIQEGNFDPWLYFLLAGKIRVTRGDAILSVTDQIGEIFGEMSLIDRLPRFSSVCAEGKAICLSVDTARRERLATEEDATNLLNLLYRVAAQFACLRLRQITEELIQAKSEMTRLSLAGI